MEWLLLYLGLGLLALIWFFVFCIFKKDAVANAGFGLFALAAGIAAIAWVTAGFEKNVNILILFVLAIGIGVLIYPMLAIDTYIKSGKYCRRFNHKPDKNCRCKRCNQSIEHERGSDCLCKRCRLPMGHVWIPKEEGKCYVECSLCGFRRNPDGHIWIPIPGAGAEFCSLCNERRTVQIRSKDSSCEKSESGHKIAGCHCEHCGTIIFEAHHNWTYVSGSSYDGSGDTRYKCNKCGLIRSDWWNPYREDTSYTHEALK